MKELLIKTYFYVHSGQSVVDSFRYLIIGVFALYVTLKLVNPVFLVLMFIFSIPILFVIGWFNVHKISKVSERLSIEHGTHYGMKQFELIEKQTKLLEEIKDKLNG